MTTQPAPTADRTTIARQSIHDRDGTVIGYELVFRAGAGLDDASEDAVDSALTEAIRTTFGEFGLDRLGARRNFHVALTRGLLTGAQPAPFGPYHVVLELLHPLQVDTAVLNGVRALKRQGFRVAIDGDLDGPSHPELLPAVDLVKLDIAAAGGSLGDLARYVRSAVPQARLVADGVADGDSFEACRTAGFELFQGGHFRRRTAPAGTAVSPSQAVSLHLLAALSDAETPTDELERIVSADPGLTLRVLGVANSASGAGQQVRSLRQALVLAGRRTLSAWVMLAALGGHPEGRREDLVDVLTRARMCEALGPEMAGLEPPVAYALGLLSALVEVMGAEPAQAARSARLEGALEAALVDGQGPAGQLLADLSTYARTGSARLPRASEMLLRAHLEALAGAVGTIDAIMGDGTQPSP